MNSLVHPPRISAAVSALESSTPRPSRCPFGRLKAFLLSARQVDSRVQSGKSCQAQQTVLSWIRNFVAKPNADLGRSGPVCPFLPRALKQDSVMFQTINAGELAADQIDELVKQYASLFLITEPTKGNARLNKTIVLIFQGIEERSVRETIELTHQRLKPYFVERGLMLGEFHKDHQAGGVRNENFRPLQSPLPLLVIRYMVPSDLTFLDRSSDPRHLRVRFVGAYNRLFRRA